LPVSKIMGVGKVTTEKLKKIGVVTCGDLQQVPVETLAKRFGKYGPRLAQLAHGNDDRSVKTSRVRKSISVERTYAEDIHTEQEVVAAMPELLEELARRFEKIDTQYVPNKRYVKVKFNTFSQTTLEEIISGDARQWLSQPDFERLVANAWRREQRPVRLLGAGLRLQPANNPGDTQFELFSDEELSNEEFNDE
ncbi:MAG: DNA polymerase IV, partial [Gammaproteobacteria bacterium]|nr:DNA polymerase IV [Gammaproteobacteria bacterium]